MRRTMMTAVLVLGGLGVAACADEHRGRCQGGGVRSQLHARLRRIGVSDGLQRRGVGLANV
mgnify:CR=1 FL=1